VVRGSRPCCEVRAAHAAARRSAISRFPTRGLAAESNGARDWVEDGAPRGEGRTRAASAPPAPAGRSPPTRARGPEQPIRPRAWPPSRAVDRHSADVCAA
jgi:hypothetical protein